MSEQISDIQVQRILEAIFCTRSETMLCKIVGWAYKADDGTLRSRIGDWADNLRIWKQRRRAERKLAMK